MADVVMNAFPLIVANKATAFLLVVANPFCDIVAKYADAFFAVIAYAAKEVVETTLLE